MPATISSRHFPIVIAAIAHLFFIAFLRGGEELDSSFEQGIELRRDPLRSAEPRLELLADILDGSLQLTTIITADQAGQASGQKPRDSRR